MLSRLKKWISSTQVRFPAKGPQFDPAKKKTYLEKQRTSGKERLEKQHANFLNENFKPNKDWWGSATID